MKVLAFWLKDNVSVQTSVLFRLYRNEEFVMEYTGPRDRNSFISFIQNVNQAGSILINKAKEIKNLLSNSTDKFFVSFASQYPRLKTAYKEIAEDMRPHGVHFYHVGPSFKVGAIKNKTFEFDEKQKYESFDQPDEF